jgi:surface protein
MLSGCGKLKELNLSNFKNNKIIYMNCVFF